MPSAREGQEEALGPLELELTAGCETPCGCWALNLGLLQERQVALTAEPSL